MKLFMQLGQLDLQDSQDRNRHRSSPSELDISGHSLRLLTCSTHSVTYFFSFSSPSYLASGRELWFFSFLFFGVETLRGMFTWPMKATFI